MPMPAVIRFTAKLAKPQAGVKTASGVVLNVPSATGRKLGALASVEGSINEHPFRASLERAPDGSCTIRLNQAMLRGSSAAVGDSVRIAILGPEPSLALAPDLRRAMDASAEAKALWSDMTDIARRDYVRWVDATKNPATRARRIKRTIEQLAEGKRRPCCVNTYEYSMSRIDPNWLKNPKRTS